MDKPAGPTSHDVVARARKLFRTRAVGHTGTLDPFATGLLILVFGGATRLARFAERHPKTYRGVVRLGQETDTDDRTGQVTAEVTPERWPEREAVEAALRGLSGSYLQQPPGYSARRVGGERSHRLARRGERPEPAATSVTVHRLELLDWKPPLLTVETEVSAGTYVRALARDLGRQLGIGGHLAELRREAVGPWKVADATPLAELRGTEALLPPAALLAGMPVIELAPEEVVRARHGRKIQREGAVESEAALVADGALVAVGRSVPGGWHPMVVLPPEGVA